MGLPTAHGIAADRRTWINTIADNPDHFCPGCTAHLGSSRQRRADHIANDCDGDAAAHVRRTTPAHSLEN